MLCLAEFYYKPTLANKQACYELLLKNLVLFSQNKLLLEYKAAASGSIYICKSGK